jgi:hypothetical protein
LRQGAPTSERPNRSISLTSALLFSRTRKTP